MSSVGLNAVRPKIYYVDDLNAKLFIVSQEDRVRWWAANQYESFDNQLVFERSNRQPDMCYLRVRFEHVNSGLKIQTILARAGIPCEDLPPENFVKFIRDNPDKIYSIGGKSYRITSLISDRGAFGDVFLAVDLRTEAKVTIKILRYSADQEHFILRDLQSKERHPNIVHYIGHEAIWGKTWIVMEYIQGEKFEWTQELREQYNSALRFIREAGVSIARENDRDNVMMTIIGGKPTIILIDFGTLATI